MDLLHRPTTSTFDDGNNTMASTATLGPLEELGDTMEYKPVINDQMTRTIHQQFEDASLDNTYEVQTNLEPTYDASFTPEASKSNIVELNTDIFDDGTHNAGNHDDVPAISIVQQDGQSISHKLKKVDKNKLYPIQNDHLKSKLSNLRGKKAFTDLEFVVDGGKCVWAHRVIVCGFSLYVDQLCSQDSVVSDHTIIDLTGSIDKTLGFSEDIVNYALDFVYGKDVVLNHSDARQALNLAIKLNMPDLLAAIDRTIVKVSEEAETKSIETESLFLNNIKVEPSSEFVDEEVNITKDDDIEPGEELTNDEESFHVTTRAGNILDLTPKPVQKQKKRKLTAEDRDIDWMPVSAYKPATSASLKTETVIKKHGRPSTEQAMENLETMSVHGGFDTDHKNDKCKDDEDFDPDDEDVHEGLGDDVKPQKKRKYVLKVKVPKRKLRTESLYMLQPELSEKLLHRKATRRHVCIYCKSEGKVETVYASLQELVEHKRQAHAMYQCLRCPSVLYDNQKEYDKHMKQHEDIDKLDPEERTQVGRRMKIFRCKYERGCNMRFETMSDLVEHKRVKHGVLCCTLCSWGNYKTQQQLDTHMKKHQGRHVCSHCSKRFENRLLLGKHKEEVHGMFACDICGSAFKHKGAVAQHKILHEGDQPFITADVNGDRMYHCDTCGAQFTEVLQFSNHMKKHRGPKPYVCPKSECNWSGSKLDEYSQHVLQHRDEKRFSCTHCDFKCISSYNLQKHMYRNHTNNSSCVCSKCGATFLHRHALNTHKHIHSEFKPHICPQEGCSKSFATNQMLKIHIRTHTKPFSCDICGKCFSRKDNLLVHQRIHTGDKPYCCELCGKSFIQMASLLSHRNMCCRRTDTHST